MSFSKNEDSIISLNNQSQCSVTCTVKKKKYFLVFRLNFCCCCCCCYFEFVALSLMSEKNLSPLFQSLPLAIETLTSSLLSLLFFRLNKLSSFCLFSHMKDIAAVIHFCNSVVDLVKEIYVFIY